MTVDELLNNWDRFDNLPPQAILEHFNYEDDLSDGGKPIPNLDTFLELTQPMGNPKRAGTNTLYGINHRNFKPPVPENRDVYGLTFFTRPQLNLSSLNLRRNRKFYPLLTTNEVSIHRYVRNMLDPRLGMKNLNYDWREEAGGRSRHESDDKIYNQYLQLRKSQSDITCPLVDENLGFIPILTNNLLSLTGWPDISLNAYSSEQGHKREQWIMVDSAYEFLEAFNLSAVFRNTRDEPILLMFQIWEYYMAQVFEGMINPYLDMIANNEMDYNTRIYRFVLDESKRFVKKTAACGAAFPVNVPTGKMFDYSDEETYNRSIKEIDISFQCVGADYNDYATINEFNFVSAMFCSDMRKVVNGETDNNMVQIPRSLLVMLNHRGYPFIDPYTLELKWYISKDSQDLAKVMRHLKRTVLNKSMFTGK